MGVFKKYVMTGSATEGKDRRKRTAIYPGMKQRLRAQLVLFSMRGTLQIASGPSHFPPVRGLSPL